MGKKKTSSSKGTPSYAMTGARAVFAINGVDIAIASNCSYDWTGEVEEIRVIDKLETEEHAEVGIKISFECDTFRVYQQSATSLGIQPRLDRVFSHPELTVTIRDKIQNVILFAVTGVKLVGRHGRVGARSVWTETLRFVGRIPMDEGTLP